MKSRDRDKIPCFDSNCKIKTHAERQKYYVSPDYTINRLQSLYIVSMLRPPAKWTHLAVDHFSDGHLSLGHVGGGYLTLGHLTFGHLSVGHLSDII